MEKRIEFCRSSHDKSIKDLIKCTKLPKDTEICYLDDTYYPQMNYENVYYIKVKPYTHDLDFDVMIQRFINSNTILSKIIVEKYNNDDFIGFMKENMNKYEFVKKYKIHILTSLLVIFFFRSCSKSGDVRKLEKVNIRTTKVVDSLTIVVKGQKDTINNISEVIRIEKIKIHTDYDNYISSKNRGEQLMELHKIVKQNLKDLEK